MKKRLLFAAYNLDFGGIENALINLLDNINYDKYEVTLVLEKKEGVFLDKLNRNVILKEIRVSNSKNIFIRKVVNFIRKFKFRLSNKNKYDFSCCYATYSYSSNKIALIASKNSTLYVHSDYSNLYNKEQFLEFFNSRNVTRFNKIIFVSNEARQSFLNYYPDLNYKLYVFNNFIDVDKIKELSKEKIDLRKKTNKKLFVFIGRLDDSSKKLSRAINLVKNIGDIYLWVIGDGPDRNKYEELVKKFDISDRVTFTGAKKNPYCYLKEADYFILTSDYEGFPVTFLESIVLNRKIITTVNASDESINIVKQFGYLISKDEKEMVKQVKEIINKKDKFEEVDLKQIQEERMDKLEEIFDEVI